MSKGYWEDMRQSIAEREKDEGLMAGKIAPWFTSEDYVTWEEDDDGDYEEDYEEDLVNEPPHYGSGDIECIDYMRDNMSAEGFIGYLEGSVKKYGHRFRYKGKPLEDLKKQAWYLNRLIEEMEGN